MYSHSRLSTYENCPRKFAFRYVEQVKVAQETTAEAFMGSMVHDTLEQLYKWVEMERTPKWEDLNAFYEDAWTKGWNENILIVREHLTGEDYKNLGRRCVMDYFKKFYPFRDARVLGLEERLVFDLDPSGHYKIQGFIDRLAEAEDGAIEIHDYKTNQRMRTQEEVDRDRQLALYQIGIQRRLNDVKNVRLIWHYLRANRSLVSTRTPDQLEELRFDTIRLIDTIEEAKVKNDFPPHESMLCDWCEFRELCPAKRHAVVVAAMSPQEFAADDGVKLADQYAQARRRLDQAEQRVEELKQQIVDFAARMNFTKLQGHGVQVSVTRSPIWKLPATDDPQRKVLEGLVRDSGLWDKVSDLSKSKLTKTIDSKSFDPVFRDQIQRFLTRDIQTTVRLSIKEGNTVEDGPDPG
ncbi:MAG TPA: PD-(D/E)XK nuclease family protein [bacterium]|nr:PD-(D/E)XK nuclease family protein [bacterium]